MGYFPQMNLWESNCFEQEVFSILQSRSKSRLSPEGLITAAVLVPLFFHHGKYHVLLTKRSDFVEHHRGEISFPGGKFDPTDTDFCACALRETAEEIGVHPSDVKLLGELDDFYTVATKFLVVPYVGLIPYPYDFKTSAREIAGLIKVPLEVFFDDSLRSEDIWMFQGMPVEVISYRYKEHNIWGATARILKHFTELIQSWEPKPGRSCIDAIHPG